MIKKILKNMVSHSVQYNTRGVQAPFKTFTMVIEITIA